MRDASGDEGLRCGLRVAGREEDEAGRAGHAAREQRPQPLERELVQGTLRVLQTCAHSAARRRVKQASGTPQQWLGPSKLRGQSQGGFDERLRTEEEGGLVAQPGLTQAAQLMGVVVRVTDEVHHRWLDGEDLAEGRGGGDVEADADLLLGAPEDVPERLDLWSTAREAQGRSFQAGFEEGSRDDVPAAPIEFPKEGPPQVW